MTKVDAAGFFAASSALFLFHSSEMPPLLEIASTTVGFLQKHGGQFIYVMSGSTTFS